MGQVVPLTPAPTMALFFSMDAAPRFYVTLCHDGSLFNAVHAGMFGNDKEPDDQSRAEAKREEEYADGERFKELEAKRQAEQRFALLSHALIDALGPNAGAIAQLAAAPPPAAAVAYCAFCKKEHAGGATCMGQYP